MNLAAPMPLSEVISEILNPGLALLPMKLDTSQARVMLLSIGQQESRFMYRRQMNNGPAVSFWQFESGGGVKGVLTHEKSSGLIHQVCAEREVAFNRPAVWQAMMTDDLLGVCMARLLLYTDPKPWPTDAQGAWDLYARVWRPGKPHRETWDNYYTRAVEAVEA